MDHTPEISSVLINGEKKQFGVLLQMKRSSYNGMHQDLLGKYRI